MGITIAQLFVLNSEEKTISVYIDPGHGGLDGGAVGIDGTHEDEIALSISLMLRGYFEEIGINTYLTRDGDYDLANQNYNRKREDIHKRVELINDSNATLFISIHLNSIPSSKWSGAQTFYYGDNNKSLAVKIQKSLEDKLSTNRKAKAISRVYLLKNVEKIGVLVEVGFLSNYKELTLLKTVEYQDEIANAIYLGVLNYLSDL